MRKAATEMTQTLRNFVRTGRATNTFAWALKETVVMSWGKSLYYSIREYRIGSSHFNVPSRMTLYKLVLFHAKSNKNLGTGFQELGERRRAASALYIIISPYIMRLIYSNREWMESRKVNRVLNKKASSLTHFRLYLDLYHWLYRSPGSRLVRLNRYTFPGSCAGFNLANLFLFAHLYSRKRILLKLQIVR